MSVFSNLNRTAQRSPINPLDVCTVVSIFPDVIVADKPTLTPSRFIIPKGTFDNPGILHVGTCVWWSDRGPDTDLIEVPTGSPVVAESIVKDTLNGVIGVKDNAEPGLFFVLGEKTAEQIKKEYKGKLEAAEKKQREWFLNLIRIADSLWSRANGNPLAVPGHAKLGVEYLQIDKPWMGDIKAFEKSKCPGCGNLYDPNYPICAVCKTIVNVKLFEERKLQKAG